MADPQVGELFPMNEAFPQPLQPGGRLTPVTMPAQDVDSKTGRWVAFCGHSFNTFEILAGMSGGVKSAFICCPVCRGIERIITPFDDVYSEVNQAILS